MDEQSSATSVKTSTSSSSGDSEAPTVDKPLDIARFQRDPCRSLTTVQTQDLDLPPVGEPVAGRPLGNACLWRNPETRGEAEIQFSDQGLGALYRLRDRAAYFEELPPIEGYPAVARSEVDEREKGRCTVVVGVSDQVTFHVPTRLSPRDVGDRDPCEAAVEVAGMAVLTMRSGT
jgi:hypothetical protein